MAVEVAFGRVHKARIALAEEILNALERHPERRVAVRSRR